VPSTPGVVAQPGGHGHRPVQLIEPPGLVHADRRVDLGVQPVTQPDRLDESVPLDGHIEVIDRRSQFYEHACDHTPEVWHN